MEYNVNRYKEMILLENQKQNLISRKNPVIEVEKHIQDSMAAIKYVRFKNRSVIDIGSGAGFPGMVLAILNRESSVSLLEVDQKKSAFLQSVIDEMNISNVKIVKERAEIAGRDLRWRDQYDLATSRAVASVAVLVEYALPFLKIGGHLIMWKSANYQKELEEAGHALQVIGGEVVDVFQYNLMEGLDRSLIVVAKKQATPEKYPRRPGIPGKRPL